MRAVSRLSPAFLVILAVACAPFGEGIIGGGSSSSFSSVGSSVPAPGDADTQAQELLFRALGDAISLTTSTGGSFADVDGLTLGGMDPGLDVVGDVPARVGVVSIDLASHDGLVMSTRSRSGRSYCISMASATGFSIPEGGTVDAHGATSVRDCAGKNWMSGP
jgi:hypothetical protein